ncbi:MAG: class I SAM-dependent methyltransferase [Mesorhizobium sp.]|nr:MAG: class I SAM-dependent methyltransferase [Mesorhizobium sp.]TIL93911.1 MAG: class I SAM-dependent methyltransferase [Mesorhizobium sp.]TIM02548.1 MAG: class I SAM-dependent methyltransferase [Mesorhizobium sp.]TIM35232.1 MAG: class I SAM-dependent methyltransferase [Mesorhizobium sp.]
MTVDSRERLRFVARERCPGCGSTNIAILYDSPFSQTDVRRFVHECFRGRISDKNLNGARYTIAQCRACILYFQREILDSKGMEFLYDDVSDESVSLAKRERAGRSYFNNLLRSAGMIEELLYIPPVARHIKVLDFGMGWGHWAIAARALGYDVVGAELSARRKSFAAAHGIQTIDPSEVENERFDFIHMNQVLEHVSEPRESVRQLARILKPSGIIKISVPFGELVAPQITSGWKIEKNELYPLGHINAFTDRSLDTLCESVGLKRVAPSEYVTPKARLRALYRKLRWPRRANGYFRKNEGRR